MNAIEQNIFFELLRSSLWGTKVNYEEWPKGWDWLPILKTVKGQALVTLMLEPILALPENLQPDGATIENYSKQMGANMLRHGSLNKDLNEILRLLESKGFRPVLLKGQGNSTFYPKPLLRKCGDLDIYVGLDRFEEACAVLRSWKPELCSVGKDVKKHTDFHFGKTEVELHRYVEVQHYPYPDKPFQTIIKREFENREFVEIGGGQVSIPPKRVNALYVFDHLWNHVRRGGVGLRQFCDLAMVLHKTYQYIDANLLASDLKQMKMREEWLLVGNLLVRYMGFPKTEFPFYKDIDGNKVKALLRLVLTDGNFGTSRGKEMGKGYFSAKVSKISLDAERSLQLAQVSKRLALKVFTGRFLQGMFSTLKGE